jgi:hypothetical protein
VRPVARIGLNREHRTVQRLGALGLLGIGLFVVGVAVFAYGIVDVTADAPSGGLSRQGTGTPWVIFAGVGCWLVGMVLFLVGTSRARRQ